MLSHEKLGELYDKLDGLVQRLTEREGLIEELRAKLERVNNKIEDMEYEDRWRWRHIRTFTEEENLGLPVPRLEIRWTQEYDARITQADYLLVYRHRGGCSLGEHLELPLPLADGVYIYDDAAQLNLPAYVTAEDKWRCLCTASMSLAVEGKTDE